MNKLTDWIKCHQIAAFSIITFVITWRLGFFYGVVMKQGQFLLAPVMFVATCGPMLAGNIITANTNTGNAVFSNMDSLILIVGLAVAGADSGRPDMAETTPDHPAVYQPAALNG